MARVLRVLAYLALVPLAFIIMPFVWRAIYSVLGVAFGAAGLLMTAFLAVGFLIIAAFTPIILWQAWHDPRLLAGRGRLLALAVSVWALIATMIFTLRP